MTGAAHRYLRALALLFGLTCAGCDAGMNDMSADAAPCASDDDCVAGVCQFGVCGTDAGDATWTVALSIEPPDFRPDLVAQQTTSVQVGAGRELPDFRLSTPVLLSGFVAYDNGVPVEGDVRFRAVNGVAGRRIVATAQTEPGGGIITATVAPGRYDVTVIPNRADVPRTILRDQLISTGSPDTCPGNPEVHCQVLQLIVPSAQRYVPLRGVVQRREPRIVPVAGTRVYATSADGQVESTTATTAEDGSFLVFIDPTVEDVAFHVRSGDDTSVPSYDFVPIVLPDTDDVDIVLSLGNWTEPTPWTVNVKAPDGTYLDEALVTARTEREPDDTADPLAVPIERVTWERQLTGDEASSPGTFSVDLAPGSWELTAAALGLPWGPAGPVVVEVGDTPGTTDMSLDGTRRIEGRVISGAAGAPLAGARVEFMLTSVRGTSVDVYGIGGSMVGATPVTDDSGRFSAELPPGVYSATVVPTEVSGLARYTTPIDLEATDFAVISVPPAGVTFGRVLDRDGSPLPGATVEAWTDEGDAILLARSVTDADGEYRLLLPLPAP